MTLKNVIKLENITERREHMHRYLLRVCIHVLQLCKALVNYLCYRIENKV